MSKPKKQTEGYKALWTIIHATPTDRDLKKVIADLGGHDDRIAAVHHLANILHWVASVVEADCDKQSDEYEKLGDRSGDDEVGKHHYMSRVWYAIDAHRMANYCARVEEAHERDDELESLQQAMQDDHEGQMTKEQAEEAIERI